MAIAKEEQVRVMGWIWQITAIWWATRDEFIASIRNGRKNENPGGRKAEFTFQKGSWNEFPFEWCEQVHLEMETVSGNLGSQSLGRQIPIPSNSHLAKRDMSVRYRDARDTIFDERDNRMGQDN